MSSKSKSKALTNKNDLTAVQAQYQQLPYPMRDPEEENTRLLSIVGESLAELNHWLYRGKENFKSGFRVLVAGGGTGDSSTFLGEQLKNTNAEIVYLDFSFVSMEIAQKRAEIRGLKNITWIQDSILNIPKLNLGKFDFINCSGVLHHLGSPDEGLQILSDSLSMRGGMHLMVYAKYGRTGLYHIQDMMKIVNEGVTNIDVEIKNAKSILSALPTTNWFARAQELISDHVNFGDIGLYDMFLHKQDRAYTIPELYQFVEHASLHLVEFAVPESRLLLKPQSYIKDLELLTKIKGMDIIKQRTICELISGKIIKHDFFVSKQKDSIASVVDLDNIPYFYYNTGHIPQQMYDHFENNNIVAGSNINFNLNFPAVRVNADININTSQCTKYIFKHLVGGTKTLREIFDAIKQELQVDIEDKLLVNELQITLAPFFEVGILFLRHQSINPYTDYTVAKL
ncbi:class I SAM-dependent methyltransferase [Candidatus Trichorickettsia mobilis]|uniref:class I SAM-dependent methyltransferase n=1 Tax=Candidatus Trichorickettsia mobilis TaxID=1346319 RepID=UPI002930C411|nr:methyltransferase domain-containing protein [Candidatus Trichorickettsia mobilis]